MIEVRNLTKQYRPKKGEVVQALKGINLKIEDTGLVFILGKSGSGKSTLLNMLGGLDQFDDGEIIIKGKSSKEFNQSDFDSYRNTFVGFIFQEYNILNDFTVGANIALAMELQGKKVTKETLNAILKEVDLEGFADRKPNELSGGQKQRVAIARALIKNPEIIMADEPTGALDSNTGKQVFDTLKRLSKEKLVLVVSHDREFAEEYGDRVIEMRDGVVVEDIKKYTAKASNVNEGIQVINENLIHIKPNYELTDQDIQMITDYLKNHKGKESFISVDGRTNAKMKQVAQIDASGNQQAFETTTEENLNTKQYDGTKLTLITSKLPFKSSMKMAFGSMKKKPFRLAMTVVLATVAFSLFGLVNTMSAYNKIEAGTNSIIDSNIDYLAFVKEQEIIQGDYSYYSSDKMTEEDVKNIQGKFPDQPITPVVQWRNRGISISNNIGDSAKLNPYGDFAYYPSSVSGVATVNEDTIKSMGYSLIGTLPEKENEVVITKVIADSFIQGGYVMMEDENKVNISSAEEMIGKKLQLSVEETGWFTITGILDTNFDGSRYELFKKELNPTVNGFSVYMLQSELSEVYRNSFHTLLITSNSLYKKIIDNNVGIEANGSTYYMEATEGEKYYQVETAIEFDSLSESMRKKITFFEEGKTSLDAGEMIVDAAFLGGTSVEPNHVVQFDLRTMGNGYSSNQQAMKIVGIYEETEGNGTVILPNGILSQNGIDDAGTFSTVLTAMPKSREQISDVIMYSYDNGIDHVNYTLSNATRSFLDNVNSFVEDGRTIFTVLATGFAIFAGLMLMNFISTSISYRKREIGILRAVGARGRDVFTIFFQESVMIALLNWICSIIATAVVVTMLNRMFRTDFNLTVTIFNFGMIQIVSMLVLSVGVAFVSSFFPVYKVSKKKPIEVIRKN